MARAPWSAVTTGRPNFRSEQRAQARRGTANPPWVGRAAEATLYPPDWEEISARVRKRDGYRCKIGQLFGERRCQAYFPPPFSRYLHVHHIIPLPQGSNKGSNLITLCVDCHSFVHGGRYLGKSPSHKARSAAAKW